MAGTAYTSLNLKWNPFGMLTRAEKQALTVPRFDLRPYVKRLQQPGYALHIVPQGAPGKTTHLLFLRDQFPAAPYICVSRDTSLHDIPSAPVYFLDQLQEMPRRRRLSLFRRPASFALISHAGHRLEFRLAGLSYELLALPYYDPASMKQAIDRRLAWARRDPDSPIPEISLHEAARLVQRFGDDVVVYRYLYDLLETLPPGAGCAGWRRALADVRRKFSL